MDAILQVESKQQLIESDRKDLEEEKELLERGRREAAAEADKLDQRRKASVRSTPSSLRNMEAFSFQHILTTQRHLDYNPSYINNIQALCREETKVQETMQQKRQLEGRVKLSDGKVVALQRDIKSLRFVFVICVQIVYRHSQFYLIVS